jgi:hypothetical protein
MTFDHGWNFRATSSLVTDGPNQSFVTAADAGATFTRDGISLSLSSTPFGSRDIDAAMIPELAGGLYTVPGDGGVWSATIHGLVAGRAYNFDMGVCDVFTGNAGQTLTVIDGVTSRLTITSPAIAPRDALDASLNRFYRPQAASNAYLGGLWRAGKIGQRFVLAGTDAKIQIASNIDRSQLAHFRIWEGAAASQISVDTQPGVEDARLGVALPTQPVFSLRDLDKVIVTNDSATVVTYSLNQLAGRGGILGGTLTSTVVNGVAAPTTLQVTGGAGQFTITASAPGCTPITTASFWVDTVQPSCAVTLLT